MTVFFRPLYTHSRKDTSLPDSRALVHISTSFQFCDAQAKSPDNLPQALHLGSRGNWSCT